ncbi:S-layer family protein [Calothrix sp. FACHB-156]|nr:S-layer family protein [Calothrix sp. FACHB-156]
MLPIIIDSGSLFSNNGRLISSTFGQGNAGNITINADNTVTFENSFAVSSVESTGIGNGGDIKLTTGSLSLTDGSQLTAATFGKGNAGNITIDARNTATFDNSFAVSNVESIGAGNGGNITLTTGSLSLTHGGQIAAATLGHGNAGDITINARDSVKIDGSKHGLSSGAFSTLQSTGTGNGGNLIVTAGSLFLTNGGELASSAQGQGNAGNLFINVQGAITLNHSYINSSVLAGGIGNAGNIEINTQSLSLTNGAEIDSVVGRAIDSKPPAKGQGGNIRVNASNFVTISGQDSRGYSSALFTSNDKDTSGSAGNITVNTGKLTISDGAIVSAATSNADNGGNIFINANHFTAINGGQVTTNTRDSGNAGTITLKITDSLTLDGSDLNFSYRVASVRQRLQQPGEIDQLLNDVIFNPSAESGLFGNTAIDSTGNGGSIFINPSQMMIRNGAKVSVNSAGTGNAGNISIIGGFLVLDNGTVLAQTASSQGGNINLQLADFLVLRRNSNISSTAGSSQASGDGGKITLNSPFIVTLPNENSDITANAFSGRGGNVNIITQSIFGFEVGQQLTPKSDITASSNLGVQGQIIISQPQVQPPQKLIELATGLVDASTKFAQICPNGRNAKPLGSFVVTGRGSLPPNVLEPLALTTSLSSLASLDGENADTKLQRIVETDAQMSVDAGNSSQIVEAQGLVKTADGNIMLVAQAPTATPAGVSSSAMCPVAQ